MRTNPLTASDSMPGAKHSVTWTASIMMIMSIMSIGALTSSAASAPVLSILADRSNALALRAFVSARNVDSMPLLPELQLAPSSYDFRPVLDHFVGRTLDLGHSVQVTLLTGKCLFTVNFSGTGAQVAFRPTGFVDGTLSLGGAF